MSQKRVLNTRFFFLSTRDLVFGRLEFRARSPCRSRTRAAYFACFVCLCLSCFCLLSRQMTTVQSVELACRHCDRFLGKCEYLVSGSCGRLKISLQARRCPSKGSHISEFAEAAKATLATLDPQKRASKQKASTAHRNVAQPYQSSYFM